MIRFCAVIAIAVTCLVDARSVDLSTEPATATPTSVSDVLIPAEALSVLPDEQENAGTSDDTHKREKKSPYYDMYMRSHDKPHLRPQLDIDPPHKIQEEKPVEPKPDEFPISGDKIDKAPHHHHMHQIENPNNLHPQELHPPHEHQSEHPHPHQHHHQHIQSHPYYRSPFTNDADPNLGTIHLPLPLNYQPELPQYNPPPRPLISEYQQPAHYAPPAPSSCGSNLLIGCQPHVQHVPCSASYHPHSAPYHPQPIQHIPSYPAPALPPPSPTYAQPLPAYAQPPAYAYPQPPPSPPLYPLPLTSVHTVGYAPQSISPLAVDHEMQNLHENTSNDELARKHSPEIANESTTEKKPKSANKPQIESTTDENKYNIEEITSIDHNNKERKPIIKPVAKPIGKLIAKPIKGKIVGSSQTEDENKDDADRLEKLRKFKEMASQTLNSAMRKSNGDPMPVEMTTNDDIQTHPSQVQAMQQQLQLAPNGRPTRSDILNSIW